MWPLPAIVKGNNKITYGKNTVNTTKLDCVERHFSCFTQSTKVTEMVKACLSNGNVSGCQLTYDHVIKTRY